MAKTNNEKQKDLYNRRIKEGWKRIWIPPTLIDKVKKILNKNAG